MDLPVIIEEVSSSKRVDKALLDQAVTREIAKRLPAYLATLDDLAMQADSESVRLSAVQYAIDRLAGKPTQLTESKSTILHVNIPQEEVLRRLAHLNNDSNESSNV